MSKDMNF